MVSRRKILSRSRDELHSDIYFMNEDDDEDVWYSKDKLYRVRQIFKFKNGLKNGNNWQKRAKKGPMWAKNRF